MFVCVCKAVRESDIHAAVACGCQKVRDLRSQLGVASECGRCAGCARDVLRAALAARAGSAHHSHAACAA